MAISIEGIDSSIANRKIINKESAIVTKRTNKSTKIVANRMITCTKKSQFEILGVAVIVLLCILFVVAYIILSSSSNDIEEKSFESKIVSGVLSIIADPTLRIEDCKGISLKDALWQCFIEEKDDRVFCNDLDYNSDACNYSTEFVKRQILDPFLYKYGYDYKFHILSENQVLVKEIINVSILGCNSYVGETVKVEKYSGSYYLSLSICQK